MLTKTNRSKTTSLILFSFLGFLFLYLLFKNLTTSVFLNNKERVNVIFYSANTSFFSLSKNNVNYFIKFPSNIEILVPGGYGNYRIGGLGKLVFLEKKPELFKKVFSAATSSFIDLYFYPTQTEIYYDEKGENYFPKTKTILFSKSNANIIDRLILVIKLFDRNQSKYRNISDLPETKDFNSIKFDRGHFKNDFQGSFYKESNRNEMITVQIIYLKSYSTSSLISEIINGEGIRVVDMTESEEKTTNCQIITKKINNVSKALANFFDCQIKIGETEISDIIIKLGNLEKDWAVK